MMPRTRPSRRCGAGPRTTTRGPTANAGPGTCPAARGLGGPAPAGKEAPPVRRQPELDAEPDGRAVRERELVQHGPGPERACPDRLRPPLVLQGAGDDLGRAGRAEGPG